MVKEIGGKLWYCCPKCGKKLFNISTNAVCNGLFVKCRQCGAVEEVIIKGGANSGKHQENTGERGRIF